MGLLKSLLVEGLNVFGSYNNATSEGETPLGNFNNTTQAVVAGASTAVGAAPLAEYFGATGVAGVLGSPLANAALIDFGLVGFEAGATQLAVDIGNGAKGSVIASDLFTVAGDAVIIAGGYAGLFQLKPAAAVLDFAGAGLTVVGTAINIYYGSGAGQQPGLANYTPPAFYTGQPTYYEDGYINFGQTSSYGYHSDIYQGTFANTVNPNGVAVPASIGDFGAAPTVTDGFGIPTPVVPSGLTYNFVTAGMDGVSADGSSTSSFNLNNFLDQYGNFSDSLDPQLFSDPYANIGNPVPFNDPNLDPYIGVDNGGGTQYAANGVFDVPPIDAGPLNEGIGAAPGQPQGYAGAGLGGYGSGADMTAQFGQGAADAGVSVGTLSDSSLATIDAGGGTALGQVYGNPSGTFPIDVPTSIDSSAFSDSSTVTVDALSTGNTSYNSVTSQDASLQATSFAQNTPLDTVGTDAALGDFGALAGGIFDGMAGIFGGVVEGVGGLVSGVLSGISGILGGGGYYGSGGFGGSGYPVVLDLKGKGISITPLASSNMFFDMANDGYAQHTAWAGAGNGVPVYDPGGGAVTQADQVNFTLWDPSAKTDMQALEQVFDTNHDGVLNASDSSWSDFYVLVTNADGTTTLETMAQAGVTSINLTPNSYKQVFTDGSSIQGETTFTRSDGTVGTAATVSFAYSSADYTVQQTVTQNADGSTTVTNAAYNPDGTLAETIAATTSADGLSKSTVTSNGSGIVLDTQTDDTVVNGNTTTETLTDTNGSGVVLDSTVTTTVATGATAPDGSPVQTVTIDRDPTGAGYTAQQEVDTTNADGSTSVQITDLTRNGTLIVLNDRRQITASRRIRHNTGNISSSRPQKHAQCFESIGRCHLARKGA